MCMTNYEHAINTILVLPELISKYFNVIILFYKLVQNKIVFHCYLGVE